MESASASGHGRHSVTAVGLLVLIVAIVQVSHSSLGSRRLCSETSEKEERPPPLDTLAATAAPKSGKT